MRSAKLRLKLLVQLPEREEWRYLPDEEEAVARGHLASELLAAVAAQLDEPIVRERFGRHVQVRRAVAGQIHLRRTQRQQRRRHRYTQQTHRPLRLRLRHTRREDSDSESDSIRFDSIRAASVLLSEKRARKLRANCARDIYSLSWRYRKPRADVRPPDLCTVLLLLLLAVFSYAMCAVQCGCECDGRNGTERDGNMASLLRGEKSCGADCFCDTMRCAALWELMRRGEERNGGIR